MQPICCFHDHLGDVRVRLGADPRVHGDQIGSLAALRDVRRRRSPSPATGSELETSLHAASEQDAAASPAATVHLRLLIRPLSPFLVLRSQRPMPVGLGGHIALSRGHRTNPRAPTGPRWVCGAVPIA